MNMNTQGGASMDFGLFKYEGIVHNNLTNDDLINMAESNQEGVFSRHKALVTDTGKRTGRSPNDRFIVLEDSSKEKIHWGDTNVAISNEIFNSLKNKLISFISEQKELFVQDLYCGAEENQRLSLRVITQSAWHSAFARNMFIRPSTKELDSHSPEFTILHAPKFYAIPKEDGTNSEAFVMINLKEKLVIIGGTEYAGEIKKSIFSVMNYLLPLENVLPMHCSANTTGENTAVFFGLSGTGKTTLSADQNRMLIGDDEHGWGPKGVFNFEGGCYAKLINLSEDDEPVIFSTTRKFGSILENVVLDENGIADFSNSSKTENTRGSYPLEFIDNRTINSKGGHPQNVIFLTCDAFGVLPPISKLTPAQAAYHFISGYTAKVAGTEVGIKEPVATFSACFGEPFMPMHPGIYANLLSDKMKNHASQCWLINTGWSGGAYGIGNRMKIKYTRAMLNAALDGKLNDSDFVKDPRFGFMVPTSCEGVPTNVLWPEDTWEDKNEYKKLANKLVNMFNANFEKYLDGVEESVKLARPIVLD